MLNKPNGNGFPKPKKVKCFQCQETFFIKFVIPQQNYSKKNSWEYWTGEKGTQKVCNSCLRKLYYDKPVCWNEQSLIVLLYEVLKTITDLRKRSLLKSYIHDGHLA